MSKPMLQPINEPFNTLGPPGEEWVNAPPFTYYKNHLNVMFKEVCV